MAKFNPDKDAPEFVNILARLRSNGSIDSILECGWEEGSENGKLELRSTEQALFQSGAEVIYMRGYEYMSVLNSAVIHGTTPVKLIIFSRGDKSSETSVELINRYMGRE